MRMRLLTALAVLVSAYVHLKLWFDGFRDLDKIGPAFMTNAIGGVVNAISGHDEGARPGFRAYASGIGGTNNNQAAVSGGFEYGKGPWTLWTNTSFQRTGDYKAGGKFGTVLNTFANSATGQTGFGYFGKKTFFSTNSPLCPPRLFMPSTPTPLPLATGTTCLTKLR